MDVSTLKIEKGMIISKLESKKAEIAALQREAHALTVRSRELDEEIEYATSKEHEVDFEITDHAVVRYLERVMGINIKEVRSKMISDCSHAKALDGVEDLVVLKGSHKLVVKNKKVVTVLDRK